MTTSVTSDPDSCACPDFTMSRRRLLGAAAATTGVLTAGQLFGDAFRQVAYGAPGGNVVVVLSLRGGADGLSMVVPSTAADQAVLAKVRPDIYLPAASLIAGDSRFGLHPAFKPLQDMWNVSKNFAAVHAVGLPAPNRSHFQAMGEIEDAGIGQPLRTGWINRTVGLAATPSPENAIHMGSPVLPDSLMGNAPALGISQISSVKLLPFDGSRSAARTGAVASMWSPDKAAAGEGVRSALAMAKRLEPLVSAASTGGAANPVHESAYPDGPLRSALANTAALIRADVGAKFVTLDYGTWDMHAGLGKVDGGWMKNQVTHLAGSLKAFFDDLGSAADKVTVVTLSEFGRRVAQNGSAGLDHGWGNAMLLLGAGVVGGKVHGPWKGLSQLTDGDVSVQTSFQSVLWEVIAARFPDLTGSRSTLLPGAEDSRIGLMA